jgi:hypothetical protein
MHTVGAMKSTISVIGLSFVILACGGSNEPADGPVEKTGEKVDEAGEDVERKADEAGQKIEEAGDKVEDKVEKERKEE